MSVRVISLLPLHWLAFLESHVVPLVWSRASLMLRTLWHYGFPELLLKLLHWFPFRVCISSLVCLLTLLHVVTPWHVCRLVYATFRLLNHSPNRFLSVSFAGGSVFWLGILLGNGAILWFLSLIATTLLVFVYREFSSTGFQCGYFTGLISTSLSFVCDHPPLFEFLDIQFNYVVLWHINFFVILYVILLYPIQRYVDIEGVLMMNLYSLSFYYCGTCFIFSP
jgi:hypothetical protein